MHCSSDDFSNNSLCLQQLKCSFGWTSVVTLHSTVQHQLQRVPAEVWMGNMDGPVIIKHE